MSGRAGPLLPWREEAEELRSKLGAVEDRLAALERHLFGKKSEKMPSLARILRLRVSGRFVASARDGAGHRRRKGPYLRGYCRMRMIQRNVRFPPKAATRLGAIG